MHVPVVTSEARSVLTPLDNQGILSRRQGPDDLGLQAARIVDDGHVRRIGRCKHGKKIVQFITIVMPDTRFASGDVVGRNLCNVVIIIC